MSGWNIGFRIWTLFGTKIEPMIGENWQLVTDELVEFENNWLKFKTAEKLPITSEEFIEYTPI